MSVNLRGAKFRQSATNISSSEVGEPELKATLLPSCVSENPRAIKIIYYLPGNEIVLDNCPWLTNKHHLLPLESGRQTTIWEFIPSEADEPWRSR